MGTRPRHGHAWSSIVPGRNPHRAGQALRWTCAYTDYVNGMDEEKLRQKLGLSRISWRDTSARLEQLREQIEGPRAS